MALLTGKEPNTEAVTDTSVRKINPACSVTLDKIIQKCVSFRPQDRYQSCEEVLSALKNYQKSDAKIKERNFLNLFLLWLFRLFLGVVSCVAEKYAAGGSSLCLQLLKLYLCSTV